MGDANFYGASEGGYQALTQSQTDNDGRLKDPLPLLFEMLYYGSGFLASGSTNPIDEGMIG